jgi:hypothetical protein
MTWNFIRLTIFGSAFVTGILIGGYGESRNAGAPVIPLLRETGGAALVVTCNPGIVRVSPWSGQDAVHLECAEGRMIVVRDAENRRVALRPMRVAP